MRKLFFLSAFLSACGVADFKIKSGDGITELIYRKGARVYFEKCMPPSVVARGCSGSSEPFSASYNDYTARLNSFAGIPEREFAGVDGLVRTTARLAKVEREIESLYSLPSPEVAKLRKFQSKWFENRTAIFRYLEEDSSKEVKPREDENLSRSLELAFYNVWFLAEAGKVARVENPAASWSDLKTECTRPNWQLLTGSEGGSLFRELEKSGLLKHDDLVWGVSSYELFDFGEKHEVKHASVLRYTGKEWWPEPADIKPGDLDRHVAVCLSEFGGGKRLSEEEKSREYIRGPEQASLLSGPTCQTFEEIYRHWDLKGKARFCFHRVLDPSRVLKTGRRIAPENQLQKMEIAILNKPLPGWQTSLCNKLGKGWMAPRSQYWRALPRLYVGDYSIERVGRYLQPLQFWSASENAYDRKYQYYVAGEEREANGYDVFQDEGVLEKGIVCVRPEIQQAPTLIGVWQDVSRQTLTSPEKDIVPAKCGEAYKCSWRNVTLGLDFIGEQEKIWTAEEAEKLCKRIRYTGSYEEVYDKSFLGEYRLPNKDELLQAVKDGLAQFEHPNFVYEFKHDPKWSSGRFYWTKTRGVKGGTYAVSVETGKAHLFENNELNRVLCVRGGEV